ncbi:MAG: fused MFS/spermidine synthase [Candidatus Obscuribacterales bacterium]|jgi:spermidine synthase|nr:fused MFS/spermidine synthase [Candidatus Obscuribacterales bacterium]
MTNSASAALKDRFAAKYWFVVILFLVSGLSSLIYQVIWTRSLVFVFGSTQFATSTVLSVFMAGLALGSFIAGKQSDKGKIDPFLLYGILEGLIAVWALLSPLLFNFAVPIYQSNFQHFHLNPILFGMLRYLVAAVILLPPTTCMGATLPLLSKYVTESIETAGNKVGTLYAVNTFGAVLGAMMAGFFLIPTFGLSVTTIVASAMNFAIFATVVFLWYGSRKTTLEDNGKLERISTVEDTDLQSSKEVRVLLWCFLLSGGLSMFYEVGWTRILLMVIGSTTYAFTIMLSTFLIGIFAGSFFCAKKVDKLKSPITWFAIAQAYLCFAGLLSLAVFNYLPYTNLVLGMMVKSNELLSMLLRFLGAAVVLLPITLSLGALFPLAVKVCARNLDKLGSSVGKLYSMNTCGAIIGAFVAGFFAIPILGAEQSLILASLLNFCIGAVLLYFFGTVKRSIAIFVALSMVAVSVWAFSSPQILNRYFLAYAQHERRKLVLNRGIPSWEQWTESTKKNTIFYQDGMCATVAVARETNPFATSLFTNGHCDASDAHDMENQAMISILPLCLKPDSKQVCIVGWGSGVTVGYALRFPIVKAICAEIEEVVCKTSEFFHHVNFIPEKDSRCVIEPSDGRNLLLCTDQKFDLILSEPSNPWQIGVCNLFTKEYFTLCSDRLNKDGLFLMWCQRNEVSPTNLSQILSALHQVYPTIYLFDSGLGDTCAVASKSPFGISLSELEKQFRDPKILQLLRQFKIRTPYDLLARLIACPEGIAQAVKNVPPNSDDRNYLEFDVAKSYESKQYSKEDDDWVFAHAGPIYDSLDYGNATLEQKADVMAEIGIACLSRDARRGIFWLEHSLETCPNLKAFAALIEADILQDKIAEAEKRLLAAKRLFPGDPRLLNLEAFKLMQSCQFKQARDLLKEAIVKDPNKKLYQFRLAETYSPVFLGKGRIPHSMPPGADPKLVLEHCQKFLEDEQFLKEHQGAYLIIADAYIQTEKYEEAKRLLKKALKLRPSETKIWAMLACAYAGEKDWTRAEYCIGESRRVGIDRARDYAKQARESIEKGKYEDALGCIQSWLEIYPADRVALVELERLAKVYPKSESLLKVQESIRALDSVESGTESKAQ